MDPPLCLIEIVPMLALCSRHSTGGYTDTNLQILLLCGLA